MKKKLILISTILLYILISPNELSAITQMGYAPSNYSIIPPAPNVSGLMKYIDFPVSYYTGLPDISIPIYTINEGSISVPIILSYHSGIKVNERTGDYGLGWSLFAGGCISRSVHGLPDETPNCQSLHYGWSNTNNLRGLFNLTDFERDSLRNKVINRNESEGYSPDIRPDKAFPYRICNKLDDGFIDMANDLFQFNAQGMTGTFFINPSDGKIFLSTEAPVGFDETHTLKALPEKFTMHDNMQNQYIFSTMEETRFPYNYIIGENNHCDSLYYISAWHLSSIKDIYGKEITFSYLPGEATQEHIGFSQNMWTKVTDPFPTSFTTNSNDVFYFPRRLSEINSKSIRVRFEYNGAKKLTQILVFRKDYPEKILKKIVFSYEEKLLGYTKNINSNIVPVKKTFLTQIDDVDSCNNHINLYKFDYNLIPTSSSINYYFAQDKWGYFNGANNNSLLIYGMSANREPNIDYSISGTINKITSATGGETQFNWEQNDYNGLLVQQKENITNEYKLNGKNNQQITDIKTGTNKSINLYVKNQMSVNIDFSKYIKLLMDSQSGLATWSFYYVSHINNSDSSFPQVEIRDSLNNPIYRWYIDKETSESNPKVITLIKGHYSVVLKNPFNFEGLSANVVNSYFGNGSESTGDFGYITISTTEIATVLKAPKAGGLRIKSITYEPKTQDPKIIKEYKYVSDLKSGTSSGNISDSTSFITNFYLIKAHDSILGEQMEIYKIENSNGCYSTATGDISPIFYSRVYETDPLSNLKIEYNYDFSRDSKEDCAFSTCVPKSMQIYSSNNYNRDNLLSKKYYKNDNSSPYKTENYNYRLLTKTSNNLCGEFYRFIKVTLPLADRPTSDYGTSLYNLTAYNKSIKSIDTYETYDISNMQNSLHTNVKFDYFNSSFNDKPEASLLKSQTQTVSNGKEYTTYYSYHSCEAIPINMKETVVTVCEGTIVSATRYVYDTNHRLVQTYRAPTGLKVDNSYHLGNSYTASTRLLDAINIPEYSYKYNSEGNIVEIAYKDVPLASYIWAYNGRHPIVEAKNISYDNLCASLPIGTSAETFLNNSNITNEDLNKIRLALSGVEVSTYTYNWLIGIAVATDCYGVTTKFDYDGFGRLSSIKDFNNYFIKKYNYRYVNQK